MKTGRSKERPAFYDRRLGLLWAKCPRCAMAVIPQRTSRDVLRFHYCATVLVVNLLQWLNHMLGFYQPSSRFLAIFPNLIVTDPPSSLLGVSPHVSWGHHSRSDAGVARGPFSRPPGLVATSHPRGTWVPPPGWDWCWQDYQRKSYVNLHRKRGD